MQRVTMRLDDELSAALDYYMRIRGHESRSEAVRALVRAGISQRPRISDRERQCLAALIYLYNHKTRQLSKCGV